MAGKSENGYEKPPCRDAALLEEAIRTVDRVRWGYSPGLPFPSATALAG